MPHGTTLLCLLSHGGELHPPSQQWVSHNKVGSPGRFAMTAVPADLATNFSAELWDPEVSSATQSFPSYSTCGPCS